MLYSTIPTYNDGVKKSILIIRNAYSYDFGGAERFPVSLAIELKNLDYQPIIVSSSLNLLNLSRKKEVISIKGPWWSSQNWSGVKSLLFPFYLLWQVYLIVFYIVLIIQRNIDIVHPQSRDDFISATIAGRLLGKKVIWTDHADLKYIWQNHKTWYKNPVGKTVFLTSKLAHNITLVSYSEKRLIEERLGKELSKKFKVIYNGVEDNKILPIEIEESDKDAVIISATSRMVTAKGISELIAAFIELDSKYQARLWLIGEGPELLKFKDLAKSCSNIKFLGFPDNALSYVAASDIFVHPSYHEGFSISLVEAAKLGMPVVACNVGGNPEIIEDGKSGILVDVKNSNALFIAMEKLLNDATTKKVYGDSLRKVYLKNFVFSEIIKKDFVPIYEK